MTRIAVLLLLLGPGAGASDEGALKMAQCDRKMEITLLSDTRFAPTTTDLSQAQSEDLLRQINALTGKRKECAIAIMEDHQKAILEACELHHCGDQVAGGCSQLATGISDAVIARALVDCKGK